MLQNSYDNFVRAKFVGWEKKVWQKMSNKTVMWNHRVGWKAIRNATGIEIGFSSSFSLTNWDFFEEWKDKNSKKHMLLFSTVG